MSARKRHTRRHRRSARMKIRSKGKFKVGHKLKAGRTGSLHHKKMKSARASMERAKA